MKIMHIHWRYDKYGGGERYLFDLCNALEEQGHEVVVISSNNPDNYRHGGKERKEYFIENSFGIRSGYRMRGLLEDIIHQEDPDILHLHETLGFVSPLIVTRMIKDKPIVQTLHTAFFFAQRVQKYYQPENSVNIPWEPTA